MTACSISNIFFPLISCMLLKANYTLLSNTIFPVIYSIPPFPVGRVEGVSTPRKTWNIDKQYSQIVLLAPRQDGTKQGRKRSHSTWFVADRWTVFPWVWASIAWLASPIWDKLVTWPNQHTWDLSVRWKGSKFRALRLQLHTLSRSFVIGGGSEQIPVWKLTALRCLKAPV